MGKLYLLFLISLITFNAVIGNDKANKIKIELVKVTSEIKSIEANFDSSTVDLIASIEKEGAVTSDINHHQLTLSHTLQQAKAFVKNSPIILMFMPVSISDIIHAYMLMNSAIPQVQKKKQAILTSLKNIQTIRSSRNKLQKQQKNISSKYEQLRARQDQLLFQKNQILNFRTFARTPSDDTDLQGVLVGIVNVLEKTKAIKKTGKLQLLKPVIASKIHNDEKESLSSIFESRPSAQVISPWDSTVVYVAYNKSGHHTIIIKQNSFYMMMTGLGDVCCFMGENLLKGEPIGRMPRFNDAGTSAMSTQLTMPLKVQLYKGSQQIDPTPYFS